MQQPTDANNWLTVLREQGRTITWLARVTGRPRRSIYGYRRGEARPTPEWLAAASEALGKQVTG